MMRPSKGNYHVSRAVQTLNTDPNPDPNPHIHPNPEPNPNPNPNLNPNPPYADHCVARICLFMEHTPARFKASL